MAEQKLLPVYLMNGEDELKREFVLKRLVGRIAKLGDIDFNRDTFVGASDADAIVAACNTLPFMCEYRLVVVKDADALPKSAQEALVSYLAAPCETTVLALTAAKMKKNTRLYKAIAKVDKKAVVDCSPKSKKDLPAQVRDFALALGVSISQDAAVELIALVGESTVHLNTELQKMAVALGKGAQIDRGTVEKFVTRTSEVKPWELVDAMAARDARKAALLYSRMTSQSVFGLLAMCLNRIRELLMAKDLGPRGSVAELSQMTGKQDWQLRNHFRWANAFTQKELQDALVSAADLERSMKSGGDANQLFERWMLSVCTREARQ